MRTVRILLFGSLALLAFGIAGLALFVWFGSPNAHRWVAHKALEAALDRDVQVDGSLTVELGAEPLVQLTGLRIDSPPWAESPALLLIERAEVRIALRPLLRRVLVFPHIALEGVTVNLETAADGRHSWETDARPASTQDRRESVSLPVFESVSVSDATVTYHDLRDGRRTQVHIASLTNQSHAASGGMRLDAHGEIDGRIFRIGGTTGSLDMALAATEPYPVDFALHLPAVEIQLTGTVADVTSAEGLDLRLQAQSPSLRDAIEAWNMSVPVDLEITADARLTGDLAALSLTDFSAEMVSFGGDRLNLTGGLANVWEGSGLEGRLTVKLDPAGEIAQSLPEGWRIVKGVEAAASISGSIAAPLFEEVSAEIQGLGDSKMSLAGDLRASTAQAVQLESFNLTVALVVPDPSVFADQLGVNPSGLGPWRGEVKLVLADQRIEVSQLRFDARNLGTLSLEGGGAIGVSTADGVLHLEPDISFNFKMTESGPVLRLIDVELPEVGPVQATGRLFRDDLGYRLGDLEVVLGTADNLAANAHGDVGPIVAEDAGATELSERRGGNDRGDEEADDE